MNDEIKGTLADDLIEGVPAIAAFVGVKERRAYYLLSQGLLPGFKLSQRRWAARKSSLYEYLDQLESSG